MKSAILALTALAAVAAAQDLSGLAQCAVSSSPALNLTLAPGLTLENSKLAPTT